jgi:hypothetical protein
MINGAPDLTGVSSRHKEKVQEYVQMQDKLRRNKYTQEELNHFSVIKIKR